MEFFILYDHLRFMCVYLVVSRQLWLMWLLLIFLGFFFRFHSHFQFLLFVSVFFFICLPLLMPLFNTLCHFFDILFFFSLLIFFSVCSFVVFFRSFVFIVQFFFSLVHSLFSSFIIIAHQLVRVINKG